MVGACAMSVGYGLGYHRLFIINFMKSCLVGASPPSIVRSAARRLNLRIPAAAEDYSDRFEHLVPEHKLIERLGKAHELSSVAKILKQSSIHVPLLGARLICVRAPDAKIYQNSPLLLLVSSN